MSGSSSPQGGSRPDQSGSSSPRGTPRSSLILETAARTLFHTVIVFSLFLLFAGHNNPGGGFIGGLVASAGLVLWYVTEGFDAVRRLVPTTAERVLGVGILVVVLAGVGGLVSGTEFLQRTVVALDDLPLLGDVKLTTVLAFDVGVYLIVVGVVYAVLSTLGGEMES